MTKNSNFLVFICVVYYAYGSLIWAQEEVRGANVLLEIQPSARNGALGGIRSGHNANLGNLGFDASGLNEFQGRALEISHSEEFGGANYDWIALAIPIDSTQGNLAFQMGRYSIDNIYRTQEGIVYTGNEIPTFSISEYYFSSFWAKRYFQWDLGLGIHAVYRQLDQDGLGIRLDASISRMFWHSLRMGLVWEGASSSATQWESGYLEYAPPEFYPHVSWQKELPYFYGVLHVYWQGAGLIHERANRLNSFGRSGLNQDLHTWLGGSHLGTEFSIQKGVILRAGLQNADDLETWSVGAGIPFLLQFQVDYSMEAHPELERVHRLSLSWFIDAKIRDTPSTLQSTAPGSHAKNRSPAVVSSHESESRQILSSQSVVQPQEDDADTQGNDEEFLEDDEEILE